MRRRKFHIFKGDVNVNTDWIYIYFLDWIALYAAQKPRARWVVMEPA